MVFVRNPDQDRAEIVWQALKIGYERIAGELAGGMAAWAAAGLASRDHDLVSPADVDRLVLDVRQASEFAAGHLPGARHIELGCLADAGRRPARHGDDRDVRARRTGHDRRQPARTRRAPPTCRILDGGAGRLGRGHRPTLETGR